MGNTVIKVEEVSKLYRLGKVGTGTIANDLNRWWAKARGKEDPFLKIGSVNDRTSKGDSDYAWALKDISFEVNQGEVLGIIGKNGAGKSTLLKLLSRVTGPTTGSIKVKGRIASLLEVGTGFHPELSGRENIYLNGAILGMRKAEIKRKFDEIVDFAGVAKYIDTPVKRYSSGMYVRLAFAVAAHLESEIMVVDEVLAVGDAEFQKKCLGKMGDVALNDGRTILFVSHNLHAVKELCTSAILLKNGQISAKGKTIEILDFYTSNLNQIDSSGIMISPGVYDFTKHPNKKDASIGVLSTTLVVDGLKSDIIYSGSHLKIIFAYKNPINSVDPSLGIVFKDQYGEPFMGINNRHTGQKVGKTPIDAGTITIDIPEFKGYIEGRCSIDIYYGDLDNNFDVIIDAFQVSVLTTDVFKSGHKLDTYYNKFFDTTIQFK
jgi:lipopolysaccharide transport system ATP-binding protein